MHLPDFGFQAPQTLEELLGLKEEAGDSALVLAGGTDLVVRLKQRLAHPSTILSIRDVAELKKIEADPIHLRIGAGVSLASIMSHDSIRDEFPGLVQAVAAIGHPSCQHHSATLGGNLLLEPRCLYYNQSAFWRKGHERCLKTGGQVCLVNPEAKDCSSANRSDGATMLTAYSALVKLVSARGERLIPVSELFTGKGEAPFSLLEDEVLAEIRLPRPAGSRPVTSSWP
ncbi:MAG: FAD binding domain-containing protein [Chlorobiales bacterium]|nr:FAD binding domain-containing protein [Chlorobiales bacterium]